MTVLILHLETATKACSVALSQNGKTIDCIEVLNDDFVHGEKLTLFIEEILNKNSFSPNNLSAISISSGPGSYTGLRIGVSVAKGMCYGLNIPLIEIDTLYALALQAQSKITNQNILCMIDARRMEVFSSIYSPNLKVLKSLSADILNENSYSDLEPLYCIGDSNQKLSGLWKDKNVIFDNSIHFSAISHAQIAYNKFLSNDFVDTAYFEPNYLKDFTTK